MGFVKYYAIEVDEEINDMFAVKSVEKVHLLGDLVVSRVVS